MTINNGITIIDSIMTTLADVDPPTIAPIEVELVYTSAHSGPVVPVVGKIRFLPTLIYSRI